MTVYENVAFPLKKVLRKKNKEIKEQVDQLLDAIGLYEMRHQTPDKLSGGQRKRVGLARALAIEPELVFFDEPTSGLDSITSASIDALIQKLQSQYDVTFVVITHDVQSAAAIADHVAVLDHGVLLEFGSKSEVWNSTNEVVQRLFGTPWRQSITPLKGNHGTRTQIHTNHFRNAHFNHVERPGLAKF